MLIAVLDLIVRQLCSNAYIIIRIKPA